MEKFEKTVAHYAPWMRKMSEVCVESSTIDPSLYQKYNVKRGLRDIDGTGVVAGLTEISEINSYHLDENGNRVECPGELFYRGIPIKDLVDGFINEKRFGFEETAYLLLFGSLPDEKELAHFTEMLGAYRRLPESFVRDIIMKAPSSDMMNVIARSVLTLYSYDKHPDDISIANVLRQSIQLIAQFPLLSAYGYQVYAHYHSDNSLIIHKPRTDLSTAENILRLIRPDRKYSELEAKVLDLCLVLHAEHGGGNNSTFTNHVVTSSGTDTYSAVAASLGSLKGPRHGGANIKVSKMFQDIKATTPCTDDAIRDYIARLLDKQAFDGAGLVYGIGHAVYSLSDPRADILRDYAKKLAVAKGLEKDYEYYEKVARIAPARSHRREAQDVQGRERQCGFLLRAHLHHAEDPHRALHPHLLRGKDSGLERPPHRGTRQPRQDHPPRLHRRRAPSALRTPQRKIRRGAHARQTRLGLIAANKGAAMPDRNNTNQVRRRRFPPEPRHSLC